MRIEIDNGGDKPYNMRAVVDSGNKDEDIFEVAMLLRQALLAIGFQPESIDKILQTEE